MHKELTTITLISKYMRDKKLILDNISSIDDIQKLFNYLSKNQYDFNTLYILNYLKEYIVKEDVAKRKTSIL